jgi:hypothetical protein
VKRSTRAAITEEKHMASERSEDFAVLRHLGAAVLAGIGLAIVLSISPPTDVDPGPVTITHERVIDASATR